MSFAFRRHRRWCRKTWTGFCRFGSMASWISSIETPLCDSMKARIAWRSCSRWAFGLLPFRLSTGFVFVLVSSVGAWAPSRAATTVFLNVVNPVKARCPCSANWQRYSKFRWRSGWSPERMFSKDERMSAMESARFLAAMRFSLALRSSSRWGTGTSPYSVILSRWIPVSYDNAAGSGYV